MVDRIDINRHHNDVGVSGISATVYSFTTVRNKLMGLFNPRV